VDRARPWGALVLWRGDDDEGGLANDEGEIFGQRLGHSLFADGFESGDLGAWDGAVE
jgi:hypothetical protein